MCFCYLNRVFRFLQVRAGDHELLTARIQPALNDILEVIFMSLGSMMYSTEYRIREVDANLVHRLAKSHRADLGLADQHQCTEIAVRSTWREGLEASDFDETLSRRIRQHLS